MSYKLIAFDMDGTLLDNSKRILPETLTAVNKANEEGKIVCLSTGRGLPEVEEYFDDLKAVRYIICLSGGQVYDRIDHKFIYRNDLDRIDVETILEISKSEKCMVHFLNEISVIQKEDYDNISFFQMDEYQPMYSRVATMVDNIYEYYEQNKPRITKLNLYLPDSDCRERYFNRLRHLNVELARSNITALECSKKGITKGEGLIQLCRYLNIDIEDTIAVGDADNDENILKTAGFSIAMGNAKDSIKAISDAVVSDNEHNGCAEAVYNYLLK